MTFRRIRHHYVYVFSDCAICHHYHFLFGMSFLTTKEGMTFRRIRHHYVYVFSDCAICHHYHFLFGMSFLTTKKGITFRCIWKAAKNCWSRKVSTLLPKCEENLGVMSTVDLTFIALITQRFCSHFGTNVESLRLHFVLHPTTSGIRHCYFLLVCLF